MHGESVTGFGGRCLLYESAGTGGARRAWERSASAEGCPGARGESGMRAEGGVEC